ncbi:MAG: rod-binding protein [Erythrobacter sp.]
MITARPLISTDPSTANISAERLELREAAEGFEAIMIRKMLESARASSFAEDTPLTGGGKQQFEKMLDEHYADTASQSGAFGFARSIEEQLAKYVDGKQEQP